MPLYSVLVKCGPLADGQEVAPDGWVKVEGHGKLDDTQFVVKTEGVSMEGLNGVEPQRAKRLFPKCASVQVCKRALCGGEYQYQYLDGGDLMRMTKPSAGEAA